MIMSPHMQSVAASASARHCARSLAVCGLLGGLMTVGAVLAEPGDGPGGRQERRERQQGSQVQERSDSRYDQRPGDARGGAAAYDIHDTRDIRADDQRRAAAQEQSRSESARRNGRMTPDERRDLRRQINEAQDLYGKPPQR